MSGIVTGAVKTTLRLEGLCVLIVSLIAYSQFGSGWGIFALCFYCLTFRSWDIWLARALARWHTTPRIRISVPCSRWQRLFYFQHTCRFLLRLFGAHISASIARLAMGSNTSKGLATLIWD
jgi:hypothetical protein